MSSDAVERLLDKYAPDEGTASDGQRVRFWTKLDHKRALEARRELWLALEAQRKENELLWALVRPADRAFQYLDMDENCPAQTTGELHDALLNINNGVSAERLSAALEEREDGRE